MSNSTLIISMLLSFIVFLIPIIYLREAYPWYFVPVLALGAFLIHRRFIAVTMYGLTLGEMLRYAPVLWYGHFNYPVSSINLWVTVGCIVLAMIIGALPKKQYRS